MAAAIPDDDEMFADDIDETPSLGMIGRHVGRYYDAGDELRMPLKPAWDLHVSNGVVVCYYCCFRPLIGRENDEWDWARTIFYKAYPNELIMGGILGQL